MVKKIDKDRKVKEETLSVSAGTIDKVTDYAFNPTREKIREMTIVDRLQARGFALLDVINLGRCYCIEVAEYFQDEKAYAKKHHKPKPEVPNLLDELIYRTAQWQKSVGGINLTRATDIALAEIETKLDREEDYFRKEDALIFDK